MIQLSPERLFKACRLLPVFVFGLVAVGCGGDGTNRISGKVTFKGQPVPAGKIYFLPDSSKGNTGGTGYADIKDGVYDTGATGGMGSVSGAIIVAIEGIDPNQEGKADKDDKSGEKLVKTLFARYETKMEVTGSMTKDFDVPEEAAKGPKPTAQPMVVP